MSETMRPLRVPTAAEAWKQRVQRLNTCNLTVSDFRSFVCSRVWSGCRPFTSKMYADKPNDSITKTPNRVNATAEHTNSWVHFPAMVCFAGGWWFGTGGGKDGWFGLLPQLHYEPARFTHPTVSGCPIPQYTGLPGFFVRAAA